MLACFNIGYKDFVENTSILTKIPIIWDCKNFKDFSKSIRKKSNIKKIFKIAKEHYISDNSVIIFINWYDEKRFVEKLIRIRMVNIREYRFEIEKKCGFKLSDPSYMEWPLFKKIKSSN